MRSGIFARMALAVALGWATPAIAGDPQPSEIALARRLFAEARTAEEAKDWPMAASKLRDAISIKETSGLRFHLAYCEEQQGLLVEALVDYGRADDLAGDKNDEFRAQIPARRAALEKRIPTVTLLFPRDPSTAQLTVDGRAAPSTSLGKPIPVNPGKHAFSVSVPGFAPFTADLSLNESDAVVTNVVLAPETTGGAPPPPEASIPQPTRPRVGSTSHARTYVLAGEAAIALGALAVGIAFTLQAASEDERANADRAALPGATPEDKGSACAAKTSEVCRDLEAATDEARRDRFIAQLGLIGAGVGAAAFAGTYVLWPTRRQQVVMRPWLSPNAGGFSVVGRF
jgi:hypothetical protein